MEKNIIFKGECVIRVEGPMLWGNTCSTWSGLNVHIFLGPAGEVLAHTSPDWKGVSWAEEVFEPCKDLAEVTLEVAKENFEFGGKGRTVDIEKLKIIEIAPPEYAEIRGHPMEIPDQMLNAVAHSAAELSQGHPDNARTAATMIAACQGEWMIYKGKRK